MKINLHHAVILQIDRILGIDFDFEIFFSGEPRTDLVRRILPAGLPGRRRHNAAQSHRFRNAVLLDHRPAFRHHIDALNRQDFARSNARDTIKAGHLGRGPRREIIGGIKNRKQRFLHDWRRCCHRRPLNQAASGQRKRRQAQAA